MTGSDNGNAVYARFRSHSLQRLRHAKAGEAIIAALDREFLVSSRFSHDGVSGEVIQPGPAVAGKTEAEIGRALGNPAESSGNRASNFVVEDGELTLVQADEYPSVKFSGGKSAIRKKQASGNPQTYPELVPQLMSRANLLRLVRQCAAPPEAAEVTTSLLVADGVARSGASLADVLDVLRRPRPIIAITCPIKGFEELFLDLLDRGFILPGAVTRSNGYEPFERGELKANLNGQRQRRITCFQGKDYAPAHLDTWTMRAAVRNRPILCIGESPDVLPPKFATAANLSLSCGPLTPELLRDTISASLGELPDDALAGVDCACLDLVDVSVAIGPGNTPRQAAARLKALAANKRSGAKQSGSDDRRPASGGKKRGETVGSGSEIIRPQPIAELVQNSLVPSIETLSGYGDAAVWATDLKSDLEGWRAGDLSWDELTSKLLLSGPPGTGKTFFARALCNSLQLPLFCTSVSTWLQPGYLGDVIGRINKAFEEASSSGPAILFIDEIDGIGARLSPSRDHADYWNALVNTLLELLDGVTSLNGVIVIGATNRPEHIDPALLRAGRLMPHIEIGLPETAALMGILRHHLGDNLDAMVASAPDLPT